MLLSPGARKEYRVGVVALGSAPDERAAGGRPLSFQSSP